MYKLRTRRSLQSGALVAMLAVLLVSCGEEKTPTGTGGTTDREDLQNGVNGLVDFGTEALSGDEAQMMADPAIGDLMAAVGLPNLEIPIAAAKQTPVLGWLQHDVVRKARTPLRPRLANLDQHYGTYDRDVNDSTEPFQGWVVSDAGTPSDGFIFRFDLQDDIVVLDDMNNEVHLQGEVRFLDIVVDEGEVANPEDDILTNVVYEIAASRLAETTAPTLVRANLNIVLDGNREPATITLGSPEANNRLHPDAAFLGNLLIALSVDITTPPSKPLQNLTAFAQLFDSVENFALRLDLSMTNIDFTGDAPPQSMTIGFAFGNTTTPASPPWSIVATLDEFVPDPQFPSDYNFDIAGSVNFNGSSVATFAGNTLEVPVDIDGDGQPDGTCPDINVTFTDDGAIWNICEVLPVLDDIVPALF